MTAGGILPPFEGSPVDYGAVSPYETTMREFVERYGTSPVRRQQLRGLLDFRAALRSAGLGRGFQWLDGSFVEACEELRNRPPGDIDLVSFVDHGFEDEALNALVATNSRLFEPEVAKEQFHCHAFFVDLTKPSEFVHLQTVYWLNLFGHQRSTQVWKGMVKIPLESNDAEASALLASEGDGDGA